MKIGKYNKMDLKKNLYLEYKVQIVVVVVHNLLVFVFPKVKKKKHFSFPSLVDIWF